MLEYCPVISSEPRRVRIPSTPPKKRFKTERFFYLEAKKMLEYCPVISAEPRRVGIPFTPQKTLLKESVFLFRSKIEL